MTIIVLILIVLVTILSCTDADIKKEEIKDYNCFTIAILTTVLFPIGVVQAVRNREKNNKPIYIRYMLFIFPPIGIYLLWKGNTFNIGKKKGLTIVSILIFIFMTSFVVSLEKVKYRNNQRMNLTYEGENLDVDDEYGVDQVKPDEMMKYMFEYEINKTSDGMELSWNYVPIIDKIVIGRKEAGEIEAVEYTPIIEIFNNEQLRYLDTEIDRKKDYKYSFDIFFNDGTRTNRAEILMFGDK